MSDLRSIRQSEFQKYFEGWEKQNCIIFNGHCFGQNNINIEEYIHVIPKKKLHELFDHTSYNLHKFIFCITSYNHLVANSTETTVRIFDPR